MSARVRWGLVTGGATALLAALAAISWVGSPWPSVPRGAPPPAEHVAALTRPTLWALSIGVSRYREERFGLEFADEDARAVATMLQAQGAGPLYRESKTLLLIDEQVSRESIMDGVQRFLGQAGPDDVAVIFMAGHGVRDRTTASYYFLPHPANADNWHTAGLRMSDFDEMIRALRRNVRRVVILLDTCHSGALQLSSRAALAADDLASQVSVGEGLFLLAAAKPGEESTEKADLGHGAFTYALLQGLRGAADGDGDGLLSVSDLFGFVARSVPRLTEGRQHPYHAMEGTDLTFAAVSAATADAVPQPTAHDDLAQAARMADPTPQPNSIVVGAFRNLRDDPEHEWIGRALRVALNTELSKVRALRVYSPDLLDLAAQRRRWDHLRTAQQLGIRTLVTGSFHVVGQQLRVDALIVNTGTGLQEGSDAIEGDLEGFFQLQKGLVVSMLRRLPVEVSSREGQAIEGKTNSNIDAYRLLLEAEGMAGVPTPAATKPPDRARGGSLEPLSWLAARAAYAADVATDQQVRALLEEYRLAHERKDVPRLAAVYATFPPHQHEATAAYLENAVGLTVELTDINVEMQDKTPTVSFLRRDRFTDKETGEPATIEIRITKILVQQDGKWKLASVR